MRPKWTQHVSQCPGGPKSILGCFLEPFWTPQIAQISVEIVPNIDLFHSEASGGRLGLDLGVILGSILGSRARHAIFAKNSTAPQREHDF